MMMLFEMPSLIEIGNRLNFGSLLGFGVLGFGAPGLPELVIIACIILLLFGSSKLPTLMRNLGRSTNEFKRGMSDSALDDDAAATKSSEASE